MGAKVIWMPLFDSARTRERTAKVPFYKSRLFGNDILTILDSEGNIKNEVIEIVDLIVSSPGTILDTSHLSPKESIALISLAKTRGVENILVTHPSANIIGASIEEQKEMARLGAYMNHCFGPILPKPTGAGQDPEEVAKAIKEVGVENCILSTDMGIWYSPPPVEGLRSFAEILMQLGITRDEIDIMIKRNPSRVLGL
jgi:dihydrodipicolinate synthase/N-acetylneuraminate lyase